MAKDSPICAICVGGRVNPVPHELFVDFRNVLWLKTPPYVWWRVNPVLVPVVG